MNLIDKVFLDPITKALKFVTKKGEVVNSGYQESFLTTFTANGAGGATSGALLVHVQRTGRMINLAIFSALKVNSGTGSNRVSSNTMLPAWARPAVTANAPLYPVCDNNVNVSNPGLITVNNAGRIDIYKDGAGGNYTNSGNAGFNGDSLHMSYMV